MKNLSCIALLLAAVWAINWGLVGGLDFNLVNTLVGTMPMVEKIVYILVGVSGAYVLADKCILKK